MKIFESYLDIYIYDFAFQYSLALAESNYLLTNHRKFLYTAYYVGRTV